LATRIFLREGTGIPTALTEIGAPLTPPDGIKWTLVEIRPRFSAAGVMVGKFNEEEYHRIKSVVTPTAYARPHTVALDIVKPHAYHVFGQAASGTIDIDVELVVEESPAA